MSDFDAIAKHLRENPGAPLPQELRAAADRLVRRQRLAALEHDVQLSEYMCSLLGIDQ